MTKFNSQVRPSVKLEAFSHKGLCDMATPLKMAYGAPKGISQGEEL